MGPGSSRSKTLKFSACFPHQEQSDVLQAGDKALPVWFDSSSLAGEDLPDAAVINPGLMAMELRYLEPRCFHGAHGDIFAPLSICSSPVSLWGRDP